MTTLTEAVWACFVCGNVAAYPLLSATNARGFADLDTRPPEMHRSTMSRWVHRCTNCGYSAPDLSLGTPAVREIVRAVPYQALQRNRSYPSLAVSFLCWSMIQEIQGAYVEAGWAALHAAWACDDAEAQTAAIGRHASTRCRAKAIELICLCREAGLPFSEQEGVEEAVLADLLRRSGQFEEVPAVCGIGLARNPDEAVRRVLVYEEELAEKQDSACHSAAEAAPPPLPQSRGLLVQEQRR